MSEKSDSGIEISLDAMKCGYTQLLEGASKIIAVLALLAAALVSFTDVSFSDFGSASFTSTLAVMLISSYLIYFSLEDAGERLGEGSGEYKTALARYNRAKEKISPTRIGTLRDYLSEYSKKELSWRRARFLAEQGVYIEEGKEPDASALSPRARRALKRAERLRPIFLSPTKLLAIDLSARRSELESPERAKLLSMLLRLLPSTVCTFFTVSVILTTKDGLTASAVAEAILKLSALPVIGFKGYLAGYEYAKGAKCEWLETKTRLLESFLAEGEAPRAV